MGKFFRLLVISVLFFMPLNSMAQDMVKEVEDLRNLTDRLGRDLNILQKQFYRTTSAPRGNVRNLKGAPKVEVQILNIEEQLRLLNGKIEEVDHSIGGLEEKIDNALRDVDYRLGELENKTKNYNAVRFFTNDREDELSDSDNGEKKDFSNGAQEASNQYDTAFAKLREGDFEGAEANFKTFMEKNPDSKLVPNANYWLGETHYVREDYQRASIYFLKGYRDYPKSSKAPDSLFKLAMSLGKLDKSQEACTTFDKLLKEYPDIEESLKKMAAQEKQNFNCK